MDAYGAVHDLIVRLQAEGCDACALAEAEAKMIVAISKAAKLNQAARQAQTLLAYKGAADAAREIGCCRATVYNRAKSLTKTGTR